MFSNGLRSIARVEALESRQLLAGHVHPSPPVLTGDPFTGIADVFSGLVTMVIQVFSESKTGGLHGTVTTTANGSTSTESVTGSVNSKDVIKLHGKSGQQTLDATGNATTNTISGVVTVSSHHHKSHGTFSVQRFPRTSKGTSKDR